MCNVYSLGLPESCHQASLSFDSLRELNSPGITEGDHTAWTSQFIQKKTFKTREL